MEQTEFGFFKLDIPLDNRGFGMFSAGHIVWLILAVLVCLAMMRLYEKAVNKMTVRLCVSMTVLLLELLMDGIYAANGMYDVYTLPLHLCGISVFLEVIHSASGEKRLGQFLYSFSLPGAMFALLFPDWSYFPLFNAQTVIEFLKHILLAAYVVMQAKDICPDIKKTPECLLMMVLMAVPVYAFDKLTE